MSTQHEVHVVGLRSSSRVQEYQDFLQRNGVPYRWVDLERDPLVRFLATCPSARESSPVAKSPR